MINRATDRTPKPTKALKVHGRIRQRPSAATAAAMATPRLRRLFASIIPSGCQKMPVNKPETARNAMVPRKNERTVASSGRFMGVDEKEGCGIATEIVPDPGDSSSHAIPASATDGQIGRPRRERPSG